MPARLHRAAPAPPAPGRAGKRLPHPAARGFVRGPAVPKIPRRAVASEAVVPGQRECQSLSEFLPAPSGTRLRLPATSASRPECVLASNAPPRLLRQLQVERRQSQAPRENRDRKRVRGSAPASPLPVLGTLLASPAALTRRQTTPANRPVGALRL